MLIDSHCHVQFHAYKDDRAEIIRRAVEAGIRMITVGTQKDTSQIAVLTARDFPGVFASVGLHPNHLTAMKFDEDELSIKTRSEKFDEDVYRQLADDSKVVAIGECGLDYYRLPDNLPPEEVKELQRQTFLGHIKLATDIDLPLIVHCRDAYDDVYSMLHKEIHDGHLVRHGVIHSFCGSWRDAERFLDLGFYIGINGIVTFPPKKDQTESLADVVKKIPPDRLLLETDAPYLTPAPHRGKRNEPAFVLHVAEALASILGLSFAELESRTTKNTVTLFQRLTP